jgi:hypothetical protein
MVRYLRAPHLFHRYLVVSLWWSSSLELTRKTPPKKKKGGYSNETLSATSQWPGYPYNFAFSFGLSGPPPCGT